MGERERVGGSGRERENDKEREHALETDRQTESERYRQGVTWAFFSETTNDMATSSDDADIISTSTCPR